VSEPYQRRIARWSGYGHGSTLPACDLTKRRVDEPEIRLAGKSSIAEVHHPASPVAHLLLVGHQ
jgi:hypothetical protein